MRAVDLFSGCGGMSLGFGEAGFDVVAAFDNWDKAVEVYNANFSHPCYLEDLANVETVIPEIAKFDPDVIIGGPPCQDFSSAGKRDTTLGRADLTYKFAEIVERTKPAWFVMENVEQIKKSTILKNVADELARDYGLTMVILNAASCGVPQARTRFFMIGELGGTHNSLESVYRSSLTESLMTVRQYMGDELDIDYYYRHPRNYNRRGVYSIDEPSATIRGVNRPVPKGYKINSCDPEGIDLGSIRPLTSLERARIQTFPASFKWSGTKTNLEQMIGNAVPVNLAGFIARGILKFKVEGTVRESLFDEVDYKIPSKVLKANLSNAE